MPQFQENTKEKYRRRDTKVKEKQEALHRKYDYFHTNVFCSIPLSQLILLSYTQPTKNNPKTLSDLQDFSGVKLHLQ